MAEHPSLLELLGQDVFDAFFNFEQPSQTRAENEVGGGALANENELPELGGLRSIDFSSRLWRPSRARASYQLQSSKHDVSQNRRPKKK